MGEILRNAALLNQQGNLPVELESKIEADFQKIYLDNRNSAFAEKVAEHREGVERFLDGKQQSQLTGLLWLEYCTYNGLLIPNYWTEVLLEDRIDTLIKEGLGTTLILDGYPRTIDATKHLLSYFEKVDLNIAKVLHLSISRDEMLRRAMNRGREDDSKKAIMRRFEFYVEKVHPSIDYMKEVLGSHKIALVDAHQPVYIVDDDGKKSLDVKNSILRICVSSLRALGLPRVVIADLISRYSP